MDNLRWAESLNRGTSRQTTVEYVKETLRRAILSGELVGGARLVQAELAAALETSTTPVREALRDLASEGLVQFDPHRGAVVYELDHEELEEIYEIASVLEPLAIQQAVQRIDDELISRLRKLHNRMLDERNPAEWVDLNRTFHMSIYEAALKPRLSAIIQNLRDSSVMYIGATLAKVPPLLEEANNDHADILGAIEAGDVQGAIEATLRHLTLSIQVMTRQNEDEKT